MNTSEVEKLIRSVTGASAEVAACETLNEQTDYRVMGVTLRDGLRLIVKLAGEQATYGASFERTAAVHRLVRERTSVTVAEILLADDSREQWPWRVLVETWMPGLVLAEVRENTGLEAQKSIQAQMGDAVAQLHAIDFPGCGQIGADGQVTDPVGALDGITTHAQRIIPQPDLLAYFHDALAPHEGLFRDDQRAGLVHEDLHMYNILVRQEGEGWRLAAILDFDKAWAGPPDADLARMTLWKMTGAALWQGYQSRIPSCPVDPTREALLQLLWCLEVAWDTPEHRTTTTDVIQKLGLKKMPF